jgi:putative flippase GtrA
LARRDWCCTADGENATAAKTAWASHALGRLVWFNLTNGGLSVLGNLVIMRLLVGQLHLKIILANLITIALSSVANFLVSHRFVFRPHPKRAE